MLSRDAGAWKEDYNLRFALGDLLFESSYHDVPALIMDTYCNLIQVGTQPVV